jgi:hypothetical protein
MAAQTQPSRKKINPKTSWLLMGICQAYYDARRNKRNTANQLKIAQRRYRVGSCIAFIVTEPTKREIFAATFRDRVVHHLIYNLIVDFWDRQFIYDSYSCRTNKGTHFGMRRVERFMRAASDNYTRSAWILKLDISGYFMHMRRKLVWQFCWEGLEKMTARGELTPEKRELLEYLMPIVIFADPTRGVNIKGDRSDWLGLPENKSLFMSQAGCGLPIGNLTSQLFSNIYLHHLDVFIKRHLGFRYYGRYVDDLVIVSDDRRRLKKAIEAIREFLRPKLHLTLHQQKIYLQPVSQGVTFLGANIKPYYRLAGKRLQSNYQKLLRLGKQSDNFAVRCQSYLGHLSQFKSWRLRQLAPPLAPSLTSNLS